MSEISHHTMYQAYLQRSFLSQKDWLYFDIPSEQLQKDYSLNMTSNDICRIMQNAKTYNMARRILDRLLPVETRFYKMELLWNSIQPYVIFCFLFALCMHTEDWNSHETDRLLDELSLFLRQPIDEDSCRDKMYATSYRDIKFEYLHCFTVGQLKKFSKAFNKIVMRFE